FLGEAAGAGDGDFLILAGAQVLGADVDDAIGVDIEGDLDLRDAARRGRNADQVELAESAVLRRHRALALQHVDLDRGLVVGGGRVLLALAGGDGGVARNQDGVDAAQGFDAQRQRGDVEQEQVLDLARQHAGLHRRAHRDHFVGVHALVGLLLEQVLDDLLHARDAGRAADEDHLLDLFGADAGVFERLLAGGDRALQDVFHHALELGAGELLEQVLGPGGIGGDERQVDLGLHGGGELHLRLLGRVFEALQGHLVAAAAQVNAFVFLELVHQPIHQALIDVVAAEVGVAVGALDLDHAFADFEDGDVEGAAAEVVDGDGLFLLLVEAVGERGGGGLVDDALHVEAGDTAGVFGGLALGVVEVGRDGDDGFGDFFAEVILGRLLQLLQDKGRDFRRRVALALRHHGDVVALLFDLVGHHLHFFADFIEAPAHEALDGIDRALGVGDGLALGDLADEALAALGEGDDR